MGDSRTVIKDNPSFGLWGCHLLCRHDGRSGRFWGERSGHAEFWIHTRCPSGDLRGAVRCGSLECRKQIWVGNVEFAV